MRLAKLMALLIQTKLASGQVPFNSCGGHQELVLGTAHHLTLEVHQVQPCSALACRRGSSSFPVTPSAEGIVDPWGMQVKSKQNISLHKGHMAPEAVVEYTADD